MILYIQHYIAYIMYITINHVLFMRKCHVLQPVASCNTHSHTPTHKYTCSIFTIRQCVRRKVLRRSLVFICFLCFLLYSSIPAIYFCFAFHKSVDAFLLYISLSLLSKLVYRDSMRHKSQGITRLVQ